MSALAGVFGPAAGSSGAALRDMMAAMQNRASGVPELVSSLGVALAAARHDWEEAAGGWSGPLIVSDDSWTVAADASLYYVADFRRRLAAAPKTGNSGELLLLALQQWGPHFARYIEGDYAIVAREHNTGRILLARDFGGRRNLVYALTHGSLVVASSPTAVIRHPDVSRDYDETFIAATAAGIFAHGPRTAYREVSAVRGGETLSIEGTRVRQIDRWTPPPFGSGWESAMSATAAEELRALLIDATRERMTPSGTTTIWMSGGWDSTSVFASGKAALEASNPSGRRLQPISVSLPVDDWGYEDDHIRAIAERWSVDVDWTEIDRIPYLADTERRTQVRDDPMVQAFESMWRAMSKRSVALGSRVALDGFGGDHLFMVSGAALVADHIFYGRWSQLWQAWRLWQGEGPDFFRLVGKPLLSSATRRWIGSVRGRPISGYLDRSIPNWINSSLIESQVEPELERLPNEGAAEFESRFLVTNSVLPRSLAWNHAIGLEEGIQLRGPLFDQRVILFATRRPLSDRGSGADNKRILRYAMKGLLPETVLAPRSRKTGTTISYFRRQMQGSLEAEVMRVFGKGPSQLERMGILDKSALLSAAAQYTRSGSHGVGVMVYLALETERWLVVHQHSS